MNWVIASLLMFISSVIAYLFTRKATIDELPTEVINFATFFVPLFLYFPISSVNNISLNLNFYYIVFIFIMSFFCSYLTNITSLKSIKYAPNPGYSLILSKSYVVFTTIMAIFLFNSSLTLKSVIAIILIVGFSAFIAIGKVKVHKHSSPLWLPYALISFFGWGMLSVGTKYLFTLGINVYQRLIYVAVFVSLFIFIEMVLKKTKVKHLNKGGLLLLLTIGIFAAGFNYFQMLALDLAPNIGYVNAINASSISALTVFSSLLFKDEFNLRKLLGVIGVTAGLIILVI